jgi:hypothetical protein
MARQAPNPNALDGLVHRALPEPGWRRHERETLRRLREQREAADASRVTGSARRGVRLGRRAAELNARIADES